jgi:hypothetical protein
MTEPINTYSAMNDEIAKILRMSGEQPDLYAAQYIEELQAEVERLRGELERAQDAFRVIGYSPAYEQKQYAFEIGADEPSKGYSHWSWYPIAIARFMRDKIRKLLTSGIKSGGC